MTTITTEITLSAENKQNLEMPKLFYQYLKERYGFGEETIQSDGPIFCSIQVELPGFSKTNKNHGWTIHLEGSSIEDNMSDQARSLIIGEHWRDKNSEWSRFAEMESGAFNRIGSEDENYAKAWFKLIKNMLFEEDSLDEFEDIKALMALISEFKLYLKEKKGA